MESAARASWPQFSEAGNNPRHKQSALDACLYRYCERDMARKQTQKEIQQLLDRSADGSGYGDPDARLNDDRKIQILLAREQFKIGNRLNWLTFVLVVVGLLNVVVLAFQIWGKH
jgi:hypothetical protein